MIYLYFTIIFIYCLQIQHKIETLFLYKRYVLGEYTVVLTHIYCLVSDSKLINKYVLPVFKKWVKIKIYTSDLIMFNYVLLYTPKNQSYNTRSLYRIPFVLFK